MPKVSIYLPDDLYDAVRRHGLPVSSVAQKALEAAVAQQGTRAWVDQARRRPIRHTALDTSTLLAEVRDEFGR